MQYCARFVLTSFAVWLRSGGEHSSSKQAGRERSKMRRIAMILALVLGVVVLSGCTGFNWSDPLHPSSTNCGNNNGCGC